MQVFYSSVKPSIVIQLAEDDRRSKNLCPPHRVVCASFNHYHSKQICTRSQWFLNLLPNQAWEAKLADQAWFERKFKNHWLPTRVIGIKMECSTPLWTYLIDWLGLAAEDSRTTDSGCKCACSGELSILIQTSLVGSQWFLNFQSHQSLLFCGNSGNRLDLVQ